MKEEHYEEEYGQEVLVQMYYGDDIIIYQDKDY